jgi:NUMOD3 motif
MKITWETIENLFLTKKGYFRDPIRKKTYIYRDRCKGCGEPFLKLHGNSKGEFCSRMCQVTGENNPFYNHKHTEKTKKQISKTKITFKNGYWTNNIPLYDTYAPQLELVEEVIRNKKDENILEVKCVYCGKWYIPNLNNVLHRIQYLNGNEKYTTDHRFYCSDGCRKECPIYGKTEEMIIKETNGEEKKQLSREVQSELRKMRFEIDEYKCIKCGNEEKLHCHHIEGIRWNPLESADLDNCITVCIDCHEEIHKIPGCKKVDMQCKVKDRE